MDWLRRVHETTKPKLGGSVRAGDQVRVWYRIQEKGRVRTASFEGTVLRIRGNAATRTITLRRVTFGEGVERVFPLDSPTLERVEQIRRGKVRRSRLYFLRTIIGKSRIVSTDVSLEKGASKKGGVTNAKSGESDNPSFSQAGGSDAAEQTGVQAAAPAAAEQPQEDATSA